VGGILIRGKTGLGRTRIAAPASGPRATWPPRRRDRTGALRSASRDTKRHGSSSPTPGRKPFVKPPGCAADPQEAGLCLTGAIPSSPVLRMPEETRGLKRPAPHEVRRPGFAGSGSRAGGLGWEGVARYWTSRGAASNYEAVASVGSGGGPTNVTRGPPQAGNHVTTPFTTLSAGARGSLRKARARRRGLGDTKQLTQTHFTVSGADSDLAEARARLIIGRNTRRPAHAAPVGHRSLSGARSGPVPRSIPSRERPRRRDEFRACPKFYTRAAAEDWASHRTRATRRSGQSPF